MSLYLIGAGGHAKVVLSTLRAANREPDGLLDDDVSLIGKEILGVSILGAPKDFSGRGHEAIVAIGGNKLRNEIAENYSFNWATAVHPRAWVDTSVTLGEGTVIFAGAIVQPGSVIGRHVILNTSSSVDHDCVIGDFCHIAPGTHLAGTVRADEGAFVGIGSCIIPNRSIGAWSIVGAGSVVIRDVEPGMTVLGCPARSLSA